MIIGVDASRANRRYKTGTEWYSYNLIRQLARLDSKNEYVLYTDLPLKGGLVNFKEDNFIEENESVIFKDGFQVLKSPHNNFRGKVLGWPWKFLWTQGRLSLEMLFKRPDVLFVPAHVLPIIHPRKSIVTIHDVGFVDNESLYKSEELGPHGKKRHRFLNLLMRSFTGWKYDASSNDYLFWSTAYALQKAKKVITISNFSKQEILKHFKADPEKVAVVLNGYDDTLYRPVDSKEKIILALKKYSLADTPYIFYSGRLEKKKNTPALVEAFAIMKAAHKDIKHKLVLAGKPGFGYDEVVYTIKEYGLENEVIFTGWVENNDMPYFYSGASAFIMPSFYEGFGIPLIEAMACGTPVIAADCASIPEVAGDAALLFNPEDKNAMAEAMAKVITDNDLRNKLIAAGKERVKNFSWEKCARETMEVIGGLRG